MLLTPNREPLFISEINVQKNTEHPNVVKLFEAYKVKDHIWVVLEYMEVIFYSIPYYCILLSFYSILLQYLFGERR